VIMIGFEGREAVANSWQLRWQIAIRSLLEAARNAQRHRQLSCHG
jgi:hypothetical protein